MIFKSITAQFKCQICDSPLTRSYLCGEYTLKTIEKFGRKEKCTNSGCYGELEVIRIKASVRK